MDQSDTDASEPVLKRFLEDPRFKTRAQRNTRRIDGEEHLGVRQGHEARELARGYGVGIGAMLMKRAAALIEGANRSLPCKMDRTRGLFVSRPGERRPVRAGLTRTSNVRRCRSHTESRSGGG